uniref:collectin-11-like n=1 Tax=Styela clava TaxID=7725 RepID=UPI0019394671|nr:collectin-11-like [Styela clava]
MSLLTFIVLMFLCVVECCAQEHRRNIAIVTTSPENLPSANIDQYDIRMKALEQKLEEIEREKVKKCSPTSCVKLCDMTSLVMEKSGETVTNASNDSQCQTTCRPGKKGPEGAKGDIGPPGQIGATGRQGAKGERGTPGQSGASGRQGAKGESGTPCDCSRYDELARKVQILEQTDKLVADGWYRVPSYPYWYKLVKVSSYYQTAKKNCERMGGRLAANGIRSRTIRSDLLGKFIRSSGNSIWIGLDDLEKQYNWKWSDGVSSTSYNTPWGRGEPNDRNERCACMYQPLQYQIADLRCNYKLYYLCEK